MKRFKIEVFNIVGSEYCVEADDGEKVYKVITKAFKEKKEVIISFLNVKMLTTAFLNTAIGQLYRDFPEEYIKKNISVEHISSSDKIKVKRVNNTAKMFYNDPERMQKTIDEILED